MVDGISFFARVTSGFIITVALVCSIVNRCDSDRWNEGRCFQACYPERTKTITYDDKTIECICSTTRVTLTKVDK